MLTEIFKIRYKTVDIKMKHTLMTVFLAIGLSACSAKMVQTSDDAGGKVDKRWGVVEYLNQGCCGTIDARKQDARTKMKNYCAPKSYRVVDAGEINQSQGGIMQGVGNNTALFMQSNQQKVRWNFVCED